MRIAVFLPLVAALLSSTIAFARGTESVAVTEARSFLNQARQGDLPATVEVYLNVDGTQRTIGSVETAAILRYCHEGEMQVEKIFNRDGSLTSGEEYVTTRFICSGDLENYSGSAGVVLFQTGKIVRLVIQVDGYAPAFSRKAG